ncbi:MAG: TrkH family potassium uptake protein, partial [Armatimonadetes bacterium]|nr:TrkH family potassium uptake protein [Armatimonadota bacterium]
PIRPGVLVNYLGQLMMLLGAALALPAVVALFTGEWLEMVTHLGSGAVAAVTGWLLRRFTVESAIRPVEALVTGGLIYLITTLLAAPTMWAGGLDWLDAIFEAMSSCTTTGLSMVTSPEHMSHTFLVSRALMQFYGGLGFVVLTIAVLAPTGSSASRLLATQIEKSDVAPSAVYAARHLSSLYLKLMAATTLLLMLTGMAPFAAFCHGLTTVSTGGFSTFADGVQGLWLPTIAVLVPFMVMGAWPLTMLRRLRTDGLRVIATDTQAPILIALTTIWVAALAAMFATTDAGLDKGVVDAAFLGVSAQTGTGFTTVNPAHLSKAARLLLLLPMNIGGCIGSTAGAIKIYRLLVLAVLVRVTLHRATLGQRVVKPFMLAGRALGREEVETIAAFALGYLLLLGASVACFVLAGYDALDALFECSSALGASGFTVGVTSVSLPAWLKLVLIFNMWVGRIEIIPAALMLYPPTWFRRRRT